MRTASSVSVSVPIWFSLTSSALPTPVRDAAREDLGVRHEDVVADEQDLLAELLRQRLPALPVALGQAVLDRDDRVRRDEVRPVPDHAVGRERLLLALQLTYLPPS